MKILAAAACALLCAGSANAVVIQGNLVAQATTPINYSIGHSYTWDVQLLGGASGYGWTAALTVPVDNAACAWSQTACQPQPVTMGYAFSAPTTAAKESGFNGIGGYFTADTAFTFKTFDRGTSIAISNFRVDDKPVELTASVVPESATWAMMIGGFGVIGGSLRRRGHAAMRRA